MPKPLEFHRHQFILHQQHTFFRLPNHQNLSNLEHVNQTLARFPCSLKEMENRTLFFAFIATWAGYLLVAHIWANKHHFPLTGILASHTVPSVVAVVMTYVFVIAGGATVAQFVAGSESGMDLWSLWFHLWPILLLATAASGITNFVWAIITCVKKSQRRWIPLSISAIVMSVFAFITVAANFPDA